VSEDDRLLILTFYIVIDVSYSMNENDSIGQANDLIKLVQDAIATNPVLADLVRISVISFSDEAEVVIPLGDLRNVSHTPTLTVKGGTSYAAAFRRLREDIEADLGQLRDDGYQVYRPAVFFITDGAPTDESAELQTAFEELTDSGFSARPNIIPFGVGTATKAGLEPWIFPPNRVRSYVRADGADPKKAINSVAEILLGSIIASTSSVSEEGEAGGLVLPDDDELGDWL
jgi:uncharacterized protein YegL